jgi:urease accessory protein
MKVVLSAFLIAAAALPGVTWSHHFMENALPQTFAQGFLSGLGHPVIGLDHLAFIVAAGFFLALAERGLWGIAALILGSLAGAALHLAGIELPWNETLVAASVFLIGALVLARRTLGLAWLAGGLALAGLLHGHAYAESIFGAEPFPLGAYLAGFSLVQLAVAAAAFALHRYLMASKAAWTKPVSSALGASVCVIGIAFIASA